MRFGEFADMAMPLTEGRPEIVIVQGAQHGHFPDPLSHGLL